MQEIIKHFILPSNLIIICFVSGAVLLLMRKIKRVAISLLAAAAIVYIVFGIGPVSFWLLGNLEYRHPPLMSFDAVKKVDTIVVLTGHAEIDPNLPLSSQVNASSAFRIIETLRVSRGLSNPEILISGQGDVPKIMKKLLVSLGLPAHQIAIESKSTSTYENAVNMRGKFSDRPFILVTSAGHMPRAMGAFRKLGMNPIPAPTDYMSKKNYLAIGYLPSPLHLKYSDLAVHEYLAILWYRLTNRL